MQIVIDIPDKDYDQMGKGELIDTILVAVKNGTPLPQGHGRLIDGTRVEQHLKQKLLKYGIFPQYRQGIELALNDVIKIAPTIIEADKESETDKHSCFKCRYLGWENVGDGMNPICEQEPYIEDTSDKDSGLHKSKPTVSDKNDCYWFDEKEK